MTTDKQKASLKRYYERNRERRLAYRRWYYETNRDRLKAQAKLYYQRTREANRDKKSAQSRNYYVQNRTKILAQTKIRRLKQYGLTEARFNEMMARQNQCCAICRKVLTSRNFHVDHCHEANYVRGILCNKCNLAIGLMDESAAIALEAAHYLQKGELFSP